MKAFQSDTETLDFIKSVRDETIVDNIYSMDCNGAVKKFDLVFNGTFFLKEVGVK